MSRLIEDLLSYARFSQDTTERHELIDATLPLQTAIENLRSIAEEAGATITYDSMPFIRAHETSLLQIFQNLIGNAIHYRGPDPPRIHIGAREQDNEWLFSCADNGIGIPLEFQSSVFAPFKRLHGSDRPGSGIGLAVCKKLVERHKGRIWVESEKASGSIFFFTIAKT
jgi:two-component system, chemotaxis family, sensor kinase Cph1